MTFATLPLPAFPIGATLCSGIGSPEVADPSIDWRFAAEVADFPRAVLRARLGYRVPEDHRQGEPLLWGDMAEVAPDLMRGRGIPLPDVLVAGTPCQAFSLAGDRGGLADRRGNLTLRYVEICHELQDASPDGRFFTVWENVPGVLSSRDNAFGCLLGGIVGGGPVSHGRRGSWPVAGMVAGPRGRAAWRVLDAQFFGVAQRRRRVFLVASLGDGPDPAAVLFERAGGDRHLASSGKAAARDPARHAGGAAGECWPFASSGDRSLCLNAGGMGRCDLETETLIAARPVVAINARQDPNFYGEVAATLDADARTNAVSDGLFVRKLMASECHVLQGFPLDHCAIEFRGKPASEAVQCKALGNSIAVPVMRWILARARGVTPPLAAYDFNAAGAAAWGATCNS